MNFQVTCSEVLFVANPKNRDGIEAIGSANAAAANAANKAVDKAAEAAKSATK